MLFINYFALSYYFCYIYVFIDVPETKMAPGYTTTIIIIYFQQ